MKRIRSFWPILLVMVLLLSACGGGDREKKEETPDLDYNDLVTPSVDRKVSDCITEADIAAALKYDVHVMNAREDGSEVMYGTEDGACVVSVLMKNQTLSEFDTEVAAFSGPLLLQEGVGERAYWYENKIGLWVYQGGYALSVSVTCPEAASLEIGIRQIVETMLTALP